MAIIGWIIVVICLVCNLINALWGKEHDRRVEFNKFKDVEFSQFKDKVERDMGTMKNDIATLKKDVADLKVGEEDSA